MLFDLQNAEIQKHIREAQYGIEREGLRINRDGSLAQSLHPFHHNKNIDRDFCENQIEVISDVFDTPDDLLNQLNEIHHEIYSELNQRNELLWAFSNPPAVRDENEVPVARFHGDLKSRESYRFYLAEKYGKLKMLFSGIHFNFSFSNDLICAAYRLSEDKAVSQFKNRLYLELAKRLTAYSWLAVYLTAASPVMDESFVKNSGWSADTHEKYSSVRCSELGYWNMFVPVFNYGSIEEYSKSIERYIVDGSLKNVCELYYPVRIKPRGKNTLEVLRENGANHIELRILDVNPFSRVGILKEDIEFLHLFLLWLTSLPDFDFTDERQMNAVSNIKSAAHYDDEESQIIGLDGSALSLKAAAEQLMEEIGSFTDQYFPEYQHIVHYQREKLMHPDKRYCVAVRKIYGENYLQRGIGLSTAYAEVKDNV